MSGIVSLTTTDAAGVKIIKNGIKKALKANPYEDVEVNITYIGAPKYRVEVLAPDSYNFV